MSLFDYSFLAAGAKWSLASLKDNIKPPLGGFILFKRDTLMLCLVESRKSIFY